MLNPQTEQRHAFAALRSQKKLHHRDAAKELGMSECEALDMHVGHNDTQMHVKRLAGKGADFAAIIQSLQRVGSVMALTRNEAVVHEKIGVYQNASCHQHTGLVLGEKIDLRLFYKQWEYGFFVEESSATGYSRSLQFFDATGQAVHKTFEKPATDTAAFQAIATFFASPIQQAGITLTPADPAPPPKADSLIDAQAWRNAWASMTDTHEFFGLLRKFELTREQGLRLAGVNNAYRVSNTSVRFILNEAAKRKLEIMIFVNNPGCIQIHTGPVSNIKILDNWLNVLDPDFNLHLREDLVHQSWVVKKPVTEGLVTSLELYDNNEQPIAYLFGKRKPGIPELNTWASLICELERLPLT
ncbi:MAG: hemin-degrading factor [Burkholderiaceae bacterium]|nr:hemin-degrading factor [Burkholderiaceae bacterium]